MTQPAPVRTYDESLLLPLNPLDLDWARTWVRQLLWDRPAVRGGVPNTLGQQVVENTIQWADFSRTDAALNAALVLEAVRIPVGQLSVLAYRPHFTAARLYLGDPNIWRSRNVDGSSESRRTPTEIVSAWLNQGRAFDALIPVEVLPPFDSVTTEAGHLDLSPSVPLIVGGL